MSCKCLQVARQRASSIRQHALAYVSIRQHTSAYVSIQVPASCSAKSLSPKERSNQPDKAFTSTREHAQISGENRFQVELVGKEVAQAPLLYPYLPRCHARPPMFSRLKHIFCYFFCRPSSHTAGALSAPCRGSRCTVQLTWCRNERNVRGSCVFLGSGNFNLTATCKIR